MRQRSSYPKPFKAQVVQECLQPGATVSSVAISHGINANVIRKWMRLYRDQFAATSLPAFGPLKAAPKRAAEAYRHNFHYGLAVFVTFFSRKTFFKKFDIDQFCHFLFSDKPRNMERPQPMKLGLFVTWLFMKKHLGWGGSTPSLVSLGSPSLTVCQSQQLLGFSDCFFYIAGLIHSQCRRKTLIFSNHIACRNRRWRGHP